MTKTKLFFAISLLIAQLSFSQNITITDNYFKQFLLNADYSNTYAKDLAGNFTKIDLNGDGEIQITEAVNIKEISTSKFPQRTLINEIDVRPFSNLEELNCTVGTLSPVAPDVFSNLQYIKANGLSKLKSIYAYHNSLISVDASYCPLLTILEIRDNFVMGVTSSNNNTIKSINLEGCTSLADYSIYETSLESLNVKNCTALTNLSVGNNKLNNLDMTGCINLEMLNCSFNKLTNWDFSDLVKLDEVSCMGNLYTELDFSNQPLLLFLECADNPLLTKINIQNGSELFDFHFQETPALQLICCDVNEIASVQYLVNFYGYTNTVVSSTCGLALNTNENLITKENEISFNNPFSNELILNSKEKIKKVEIYDESGRVVLKGNGSRLNTSSIVKGTYFIKITTDSNKMISKKGIKN
ncbi:T9SS type A sorting domain-containing protein [Chryseobacterium oryctis]|uniref:T9SS type A sorting domain-containing protein n=1 Tax=Chryseobacterium oryctis TaxID=2952618 RepID=A0ABT3HMQ5_9FLAO|nr:T9SS type A sorting domain-containing protein [Chryseobacterium oryctis]MCW3161061.1 T9SS type A sorting domain-containing protein [Chryseobacterium oryctis]